MHDLYKKQNNLTPELITKVGEYFPVTTEKKKYNVLPISEFSNRTFTKEIMKNKL